MVCGPSGSEPRSCSGAPVTSWAVGKSEDGVHRTPCQPVTLSIYSVLSNTYGVRSEKTYTIEAQPAPYHPAPVSRALSSSCARKLMLAHLTWHPRRSLMVAFSTLPPHAPAIITLHPTQAFTPAPSDPFGLYLTHTPLPPAGSVSYPLCGERGVAQHVSLVCTLSNTPPGPPMARISSCCERNQLSGSHLCRHFEAKILPCTDQSDPPLACCPLHVLYERRLTRWPSWISTSYDTPFPQPTSQTPL